MSFLVRSDCSPFAFLRSTSPVVSEESYVVFAVFLAEVVQGEKTDKLTDFHSIVWRYTPPKFKFTFKHSSSQCNIRVYVSTF